ncbi:DUF7519 family protein [Haloarcula nitratireducens]|uniref:Uncharacterized protein n=1 Tax=Haloarcula nitratireducens TaxID=2487749 RepID=A0AAW4P6E7_9EURY|nr:hypothetical protein [Halomicroarcula nitratireducens]MBX0293290.1 hypothetical protein [Halomicroarcula nitratireducens]
MRRVRLVGVAAVAAALFGALAVATTRGGPVALVGVVAVSGGVVRSHRGAVTVGAATVALGVLVAGVLGSAAVSLLFGVAAAVLAWDFGHYAISLDESLTDGAVTRNAEVVRVAGGTLVAALTVGVVSLSGLVVAVPAADTLTATLLFAGTILTIYAVR